METAKPHHYQFADSPKLRSYDSAPTRFLGIDAFFSSYLRTIVEERTPEKPDKGEANAKNSHSEISSEK